MHRLPLLGAALMLTSVATPAWDDIGSFEAIQSLIDRDQVRSVERLIRALPAGARDFIGATWARHGGQ